jgi:hypothetical protein
LPALPARAASIVALTARRLVRSSIDVMILVALPISSDEPSSRRTVPTASSACVAASLGGVVAAGHPMLTYATGEQPELAPTVDRVP